MSSVNLIFLIVVIVIFGILMIFGNIFMIAHFAHPAESRCCDLKAIPFRIIVILGFMLAQTMLLMVPLDVSNARNNAGMDMQSFWYAFLIISAIFIIFVLPVCMFWSETSIEKWYLKIWHIVKWETLILVIVSAALGISYAFLSKA